MAVQDRILDATVKAALEMIGRGKPASVAIDRAWSRTGATGKIEESVRRMAYGEILRTLGVEITDAAGGIAQAYDRLLGKADVAGMVRTASMRARQDVADQVRKAIKDGETAKAAADRLIAAPADAAYADVRRDIRTLSSSATPAQIARIRRAVARLSTPSLRASYQSAVDAAAKGIQSQVERRMSYAAMDKARYNMQRVMATEKERAMAAADRESFAQDPMVRLVRFVLAPGHRHDECDHYARADMGYGPGVYPLSSAPLLPIHPNGKSWLEPVYQPDSEPRRPLDPSTVLTRMGVPYPSLAPIESKLT